MKENYCHTLNNIYIYIYTTILRLIRTSIPDRTYQLKFLRKKFLIKKSYYHKPVALITPSKINVQNDRTNPLSVHYNPSIYIKIVAYSMVCSIPLGRVANGLKRVRTAENQNRGWRHKFGQRNLFVKSNVYHR